MRRPDVDRMMASMSAREYKEWEAYERATGPLDGMYEKEMLAQLHELIQVNNILTGASLTKKGKKNPAGKFKRALRAMQMMALLRGEEPEDYEPDEDDDEDEYDEYGYEIAPEDRKKRASGEPEAYDPSKDPFA